MISGTASPLIAFGTLASEATRRSRITSCASSPVPRFRLMVPANALPPEKVTSCAMALSNVALI